MNWVWSASGRWCTFSTLCRPNEWSAGRFVVIRSDAADTRYTSCVIINFISSYRARSWLRWWWARGTSGPSRWWLDPRQHPWRRSRVGFAKVCLDVKFLERPMTRSKVDGQGEGSKLDRSGQRLTVDDASNTTDRLTGSKHQEAERA